MKLMTDAPDKKTVLLVFEGTCGFSPLYFQLYNSNRLGETTSLSLKELAIKEKNSKAYTPLFSILEKNNIPKEIEVFYYSQKRVNPAIKDLKNILEKNPETSINLLGYSCGCDTIVRLLNYLKTKSVRVNTVYTIDPIRRGFLFLGFIRSIKNNTEYFKRSDIVKTHINFFQKTDRFSLPFINLRGNSIKKADININLSSISLQASHTNEKVFLEGTKMYPLENYLITNELDI